MEISICYKIHLSDIMRFHEICKTDSLLASKDKIQQHQQLTNRGQNSLQNKIGKNLPGTSKSLKADDITTLDFSSLRLKERTTGIFLNICC